MLQRVAPASSTGVWPIPGDAPDLQQIVWAQASTIHDQAQLLAAYQTVLDNAQSVTPTPVYPAQAQATMSTNVLTLANVVGTIVVGAKVAGTSAGAGLPAGATITAQVSGTPGGAGTYNTSVPVATPITTAVPVTLTPVPAAQNPWPSATDADDLNLIAQHQTAIIRGQTGLIQQYQDLLNVSSTPAPPTGP